MYENVFKSLRSAKITSWSQRKIISDTGLFESAKVNNCLEKEAGSGRLRQLRQLLTCPRAPFSGLELIGWEEMNQISGKCSSSVFSPHPCPTPTILLLGLESTVTVDTCVLCFALLSTVSRGKGARHLTWYELFQRILIFIFLLCYLCVICVCIISVWVIICTLLHTHTHYMYAIQD